MSISVLDPIVTLEDQPNITHLVQLWQAIRSDPTVFGALMDNFPQHLEDFLLPVDQGTMRLWIVLLNEETAGALWIHDIGLLGYNSCWTGIYYMPEHRRHVGAAAANAFHDTLKASDIEHIFCAICQSNQASQKHARKNGYIDAGVYPQWGWFGGSLQDTMLFSMRSDDHEILWQQAAHRAAQQQAWRPSAMLT